MRLIPSTRGGMLWRSLVAAILVIGFAAATTAVGGLLQVRQITQYIGQTPSFKSTSSVVTVPDPGGAQTILLVGSDHRAGTPFRDVNTDTMMLVRLDSASKTINLLSIPRDLKVQIPQGGVMATVKLNAAYFYGGPGLLIKTLQQQVFPGLKINHVVDVGFGGFERMINAIGCVYADVDHRYYNNTAVTDYSSIDIQPGYQKLCGADALSFVRFRHTDSDIVRNARQQDFLRWAKAQFSQSQIVSQEGTLLKIFGKNATTDHNLHTTDGILNLFELVAFSSIHSVKQIPFPAIQLPCYSGPTQGAAAGGAAPCYVTATSHAEQAAFHEFMSATTEASVAHAAAPPKVGGKPGGGGIGNVPGLTPDLSDGKAQAKALGKLGIPIFVPRLIRSGSNYCLSGASGCPLEYGAGPASYPRAYLLHDRHGVAHYAYRMTLVMNPSFGQYYGVQGTTWQNPPILNSPSSTKTVNGKQLLLYANGSKLSLVAWRTPQGVYWVSNTLTDDLTNRQLVAIAASLVKAG
ncbi:MAG TPA: LCP family protein [Solirubrobacteraceae bacterium]|nr:LCP family protein [Solirubrobacteraceae bacterium]